MQNHQVILSLPFLEVRLNEEIQIFEALWQKKEREMTDEEFMEHLLAFTNLFEQYKVKGFFVDSRQYHAIMNVEIQAWHDEHIVPKYIEGGVEKIAFVMTTEFIAALTIEQAFDEPKAQQLNVAFFDGEKEARDWIASPRTQRSVRELLD